MTASATEQTKKFEEQWVQGALSSIVLQLQRKYPSVEYKQYDDSYGLGLLIADPKLREAVGDAYPTGMEGYFADIKIEPPTIGTSYQASQRFAFGRANAQTRLEVMWMADRFHRLVDGGELDGGVVIGGGIVHLDHQGKYSHSLIKIEGLYDNPEKVRDLVVKNVLKYIEHSKANSSP